MAAVYWACCREWEAGKIQGAELSAGKIGVPGTISKVYPVIIH